MMPKRAVTIVAAQALVLLLAASSQASDLAGPDERLQNLSDDPRALAQRMTDFLVRMDQKYFARFGALNDGLSEEHLLMAGQYSDYDIRVTRGPVIEKAGRMFAMGRLKDPNREQDGELAWGRFYSLDVHPKTPLVGMLHATIVLQFFDDGASSVGGWLDVMPGTRIEEDIAKLHDLVDTHFADHDKDPALYRQLMCKGTEDTVFAYRRKPSCSGVSFYGPPVFRGDTEKSYAFIETLFDQFVDLYLDIAEQRANDPFTESDIAAQEQMRKAWLIDQLFSDPYASKTVPFETWFLANVPPVVKF